MSFYLGPGQPRLVASTWAELVAASQVGAFEETAWVEAKATIPASAKSANLEVARDLASLSVDGGTFAVGLEDKTHEVVGTTDDYESLKTRMIQVAATRVTPPLHVGLTKIEDPEDSSRVVVLVSVPASGSAPHMVDGKYWGRSSEGKRPLGDAEVARLMKERREQASLTVSDLEHLATRLDPYRPAGESNHGHVQAILRPRGQVSSRVPMALEGIDLAEVVRDCLKSPASWLPFRDRFPQARPFADGTLLAFDERDDAWRDAEQFLYRLLVRDDAGLNFVAGVGTRTVRGDSDAGEAEVIPCAQHLEMLHCLVQVAASLAVDHVAYWGDWELGWRVDRLQGVGPVEGHLHPGSGRYYTYPDENFVATGWSTTQEMADQPARVAERMLTPLLRALGTTYLVPYTDIGEIYRRSRN